VRTLTEASASGSDSTDVAAISFLVGWRAAAQRPGMRWSVMSRSACQRSSSSLTMVAVPKMTALR